MGARHQKPSEEELRYKPKSIQLLWIRNRTPLYRRLSLNIVREICSYFGRPMLISANETVLRLSDIARTVQRCIPLRKKASIQICSRFVMLPTNKVFVCAGGIYCTGYLGNNAYILGLNGMVWRQPDMLYMSQHIPGVIYYPQFDVVYVFGGRLHETKYFVKYCEMFILSRSQWKTLPKMNYGRGLFTPCIYSGLIYLCGGFADAVEVFDPKSSLCTVTNFIMSPVVGSITAAESGRIFTITQEFLYILDLKPNRVTRVPYGVERPFWAYSTPFALDGVLYTERPKFSRFKMPERRKAPETLVDHVCCFYQTAQ